jgi:hypothetical protein
METKGQYSGLFANYMFRWVTGSEKFLEARLEGRWASGSVDYKTDAFVYDGLDDHMFEFRGLMGMASILPNESTIVLYLGMGYRYLKNGLGALPANVTGAYSGYNRESRYVYVPLRVDWAMPIRNGWDLNMNLEFDWFIDGEQKSHLEEIRDISGDNPGYADMAFHQDKGHGLRGSLKLSKALKMGVNIFFEPFIRYWNIEETDFEPYVIDGVVQCSGDVCELANEPSNTTREIGARIGLMF